MNPPANPHAAAFAAEWKVAMREAGVLPPKEEGRPEAERPQSSADLERFWQRWPDMRRYAHTARVEQHYDYKRDKWVTVVTVTV